MVNKEKLRRELLELMNKDNNWYKKDTNLTWMIQKKAKELIYSEEESFLELTINNFEELKKENRTYREMAKIFGISNASFYMWRKKQGIL